MDKSICIIGAGPAGLAALKIILDSPQYKWKPTAFEARDKIGGVWLPAPQIDDDPPLTPLYDSLTTNIPHPIMAYPSLSFPASTPVFPKANHVLQYLNDYTNHFHLSPHIRLNSTVKAVHRDPSQWKVTLSTPNGIETLYFDLVLICNGHYRIPRYPNVPGIAQWLRTQKATHAAYYRRPHHIGNTILVIGGGPSGSDISAEMRLFAQTVIHSATGAPHEDIGNLKRRGRVSHFHDNTHQVTFEDGTTESGIDHCILATGYEFSYPFLPTDIIIPSLPPPVPPLPPNIYNTTYSVFPLAKHLFPLQSPCNTNTEFPPWSIAFIGLLIRVVPFPLFESQARAILHAFAHPEALDTTREAVDIMTRHETLRLRLGSDDPLMIAKAWHRFEALEQFEYRDALREFVLGSGSGAGAGGGGKVEEWEKEIYLSKDVLRKAWVELERRGEASEWVRGVGEGDREGEQVRREWVEVMRRIKRWAEEREEMDRPKL
jgi:Flavin-binding monooxygenase-like